VVLPNTELEKEKKNNNKTTTKTSKCMHTPMAMDFVVKLQIGKFKIAYDGDIHV
jgi:hypothetical protein